MKRQRKAKRTRQKQDEKQFAKWFAAGSIASVLLAIGGLLFWYSNQTLPEPITIYKAVPSSEIKQRQPSTLETTGSVSHIHPSEEGHEHVHDPVSPEIPIDNTAVKTASVDETAPAGNGEFTDAELAELKHEAWHAQLESIIKKIDALNADRTRKYPELSVVKTLSMKEIRQRYPTKAALNQLIERAEKMNTEYNERFCDLISECPLDMQMEILSYTSDYITSKEGPERANQVVSQIMAKLEW